MRAPSPADTESLFQNHENLILMIPLCAVHDSWGRHELKTAVLFAQMGELRSPDTKSYSAVFSQ